MGRGWGQDGGMGALGVGFQTWGWGSSQGWGSRHGDGVPDIGMGFQTQEKSKFPLQVEGTFGNDI